MQHIRDSGFSGGDIYSASTLNIVSNELINANLVAKTYNLKINMKLEMDTRQTEAII